MSSARKPTGFFQQNYDKVVVLAVLVGVLASAILLLAWVKGGENELQEIQASLVAENPNPVQPVDGSIVAGITQQLETPFQVPPAQRRMLVGDLRVSSIPDGLPIPFDALVCPFTGKEQPKIVSITERDTDGDGMPDVWEEKHGFNPLDPTDAGQDADADGFTNLEEFQGSSDPMLVSETPPPPAKLRLVQSRTIPFKLRFLSISKLSDSDIRYQLNLRSLEKTYFARMNEEVEGYTVSAYEPNGPDGPVLTLTQGDKKIQLIQNKVVDEMAKVAQLAFLVDGRTFTVNKNSEITLLDRTYKVIDISDIRVVIRDEEADREFEVGLISESERQALGTGVKAGGAL